MNVDEKEVESLLGQDEKSLYAALGAELIGPQAFPTDPGMLIAAARGWLADRKSSIEVAVCLNARVKDLVTNSRKRDRILLVSAVADLISSVVSGVSPVTVSVLLVKEGLETLCDGHWGAGGPPAEIK